MIILKGGWWLAKRLQYRPLRYPTIFKAPAVEFDWDSAYVNIQAVRPGMRVLKLSAKTGDRMEQYLAFLAARLDQLPARQLQSKPGERAW